jgi:DNA-3-methyladenine glycosylase II
MKPYSEIITILQKKDKTLSDLIKTVEQLPEPTLSIDIYYYLMQSIVSQQLSVKVADIIWNRFIDLFPERHPTENILLSLSDSELRAIGLSRQKISYLKNVANFSLDRGMHFDLLGEKSDEEIIKYLTEIKGVGKWTVQMVLMFPMDRPDVFPIDDLGIQTKMKKYYKIDLEKKELKAKMNDLAEGWKPYRSLASKLLWNAQ